MIKETRFFMITVKGRSQIERDKQFTLLGEFVDTEVIETSYSPGLGRLKSAKGVWKGFKFIKKARMNRQ